jgi:MFS superfamily sulfate permease-like transporter
MSTIIHGFLLLVSVLAIPFVLNKIPLATLAAVLILVGCKLAKPKSFYTFGIREYNLIYSFATLLAVVFLDLLKGVALGIFISVSFCTKGNLKQAYNFRRGYESGDVIHIDLAQRVSF